MTIRETLHLLGRRWMWLVAAAVIGGGAAWFASYLTTPRYEASAELFVAIQGSESTNDLVQGSTFVKDRLRSYGELATTPIVLDPVADSLGLDSSSSLSGAVVVEPRSGTVLLQITATSDSATMAADIANGVATELSAAIGEIETVQGSESPVRATLIREARAPSQPVSPQTEFNIAVGVLSGLILAVAFVLLREVLNTKIRDERDIQAAVTAPIVGSIAAGSATESLAVLQDPRGHRAETYRRLRTNIQFLGVERQSKALVVTSALPGEGKSTTSTNLAIAMAQAGADVVLVDADLRKPRLGEITGLEDGVGLTNVLIGQVTLNDVLQPWTAPNLKVVLAGSVPPNPSELLGSSAMADVLEELTSQHDIVIIDSSPLLPVTDASVLANLAGGALVVTRAGKTRRGELQQALDLLEAVGAQALGIVLNDVDVTAGSAYGYGRTYQTYGEDPTPEPKKAARKDASDTPDEVPLRWSR